MPNYGPATEFLNPPDYDALVAAGKLEDFHAVKAAIPVWAALADKVSGPLATCLLSGFRTKDAAIKVIQADVERVKAKYGDADAAYRNVQHGGLKGELGYLLKTGRRFANPNADEDGNISPAPTPIPSRLIDIDAAKIELAKITPFTPYEVEMALERVLAASPGTVPVVPVVIPSTDLPPTTDPAEVVVRMRTDPKHWPNGMQATNSPEDLALRAKNLAALKVDPTNVDVASEILEFKAAFDGLPTLLGAGLAVVDLADWHGRTWADFAATWTGITGKPGDGTERS